MTQNLGGMKSRRPKDAKAPGVSAKTSQVGQAVGDEKSRTPEDPKPSHMTEKTSQLPSNVPGNSSHVSSHNR